MIDIIVSLLLVLILFAIIAYVIQTYIPLDPPLRQLIMLVMGLLLLVWIILLLTGHVSVLRLGGPGR